MFFSLLREEEEEEEEEEEIGKTAKPHSRSPL